MTHGEKWGHGEPDVQWYIYALGLWLKMHTLIVIGFPVDILWVR
jgi:hypothetical protein